MTLSSLCPTCQLSHVNSRLRGGSGLASSRIFGPEPLIGLLAGLSKRYLLIARLPPPCPSTPRIRHLRREKSKGKKNTSTPSKCASNIANFSLGAGKARGSWTGAGWSASTSGHVNHQLARSVGPLNLTTELFRLAQNGVSQLKLAPGRMQLVSWAQNLQIQRHLKANCRAAHYQAARLPHTTLEFVLFACVLLGAPGAEYIGCC